MNIRKYIRIFKYLSSNIEYSNTNIGNLTFQIYSYSYSNIRYLSFRIYSYSVKKSIFALLWLWPLVLFQYTCFSWRFLQYSAVQGKLDITFHVPQYVIPKICRFNPQELIESYRKFELKTGKEGAQYLSFNHLVLFDTMKLISDLIKTVNSSKLYSLNQN